MEFESGANAGAKAMSPGKVPPSQARAGMGLVMAMFFSSIMLTALVTLLVRGAMLDQRIQDMFQEEQDAGSNENPPAPPDEATAEGGSGVFGALFALPEARSTPAAEYEPARGFYSNVFRVISELAGAGELSTQSLVNNLLIRLLR